MYSVCEAIYKEIIIIKEVTHLEDFSYKGMVTRNVTAGVQCNVNVMRRLRTALMKK